MWMQRWKVIAASVVGLQECLRPYFATVGTVGRDNHGIGNSLIIPEARALFREMQAFRDSYRSALPPDAVTALSALLAKHGETMERCSGLAGAGTAVCILAVIRGAMEVHLSDHEWIGCSITERAFSHLQRSIVANASVRETWQNAFHEGETDCEKLGATHLLAHGIWAFKIDSAGARTDLVYNKPFDTSEAMRTAPHALVLTEWKIATDATVGSQFESAVRQAELYAAGALADLELTRTRYIVVVTKKGAQPLADTTSDGVLYRFVNIAVDPDTPSVAAKRKP